MPLEGESKGWYRTVVFADAELLQHYGTPLTDKDYKTPPETETERTLADIVETLSEEEQELLWGRFYDRQSIRELTVHMGYTSAGVTQYRIKRTVRKIREAYIERITRNPIRDRE